MSIVINTSNIQIGSYVLCETPTGIYFSGSARALCFQSAPPMAGSIAGYSAGGYVTPGTPASNVIDKFPFANNADATDAGDLSQSRSGAAGQSSSIFGYSSGGYPLINTIDRFPFASNSPATSVGCLSQARGFNSGQSSSTSGYTSGGTLGPPGNSISNVIDRFPFASNSPATNVGCLTQTRQSAGGQSSSISGYTSGSNLGAPGLTNTIDKFLFSSDSTATNVGCLSQTRAGPAGQSSTVSGYNSGGGAPTPSSQTDVNTIDKFSFATDSNASNVGGLTVSRREFGGTGISSVSSGYTQGGVVVETANDTIDKFPFSSDSSATDVGNLTVGRRNAQGTQD